MADVMLLDKAQPPQRWSQADREAVLAAAFAPGAVVSDVARQFRVSTGQIYTWRRQLSPFKTGPRSTRSSARKSLRGGGASVGDVRLRQAFHCLSVAPFAVKSAVRQAGQPSGMARSRFASVWRADSISVLASNEIVLEIAHTS